MSVKGSDMRPSQPSDFDHSIGSITYELREALASHRNHGKNDAIRHITKVLVDLRGEMQLQINAVTTGPDQNVAVVEILRIKKATIQECIDRLPGEVTTG